MKPAFLLTYKQANVLAHASTTRPIYAEDPAFLGAQVPEGSDAFSLRTVTSLVKHGLLKPDGEGGYLLTEHAAALRSSAP